MAASAGDAGAIVLTRGHATMAFNYLWNTHPRRDHPHERVLRRHVLAGLYAYLFGWPAALAWD